MGVVVVISIAVLAKAPHQISGAGPGYEHQNWMSSMMDGVMAAHIQTLAQGPALPCETPRSNVVPSQFVASDFRRSGRRQRRGRGKRTRMSRVDEIQT